MQVAALNSLGVGIPPTSPLGAENRLHTQKAILYTHCGRLSAEVNQEQGKEQQGIIGASVLRPDALDKVRGEAKFVDDLAFTGMLYAKVIRSTVPHARIANLD